MMMTRLSQREGDKIHQDRTTSFVDHDCFKMTKRRKRRMQGEHSKRQPSFFELCFPFVVMVSITAVVLALLILSPFTTEFTTAYAFSSSSSSSSSLVKKQSSASSSLGSSRRTFLSSSLPYTRSRSRTKSSFYSSTIKKRSSLLALYNSPNSNDQEDEKTISTSTVTTVLKDHNNGSSSSSPEQTLDEYLQNNELSKAIEVLKQYPKLDLTKSRFKQIFDTIETVTSEEDENILPQSDTVMLAYPPTSKSRSQMTQMYNTLRDIKCLQLFGACHSDESGFPADGQKFVTPQLLESVSKLSMDSLTPKGSGNAFLWAGLGLALAEGLLSLQTGIDLSYFVFATLGLALLDRIVLNGASVEFLTRLVYPEYQQRITKHEAGHFLLAYLLGCPVEGCVLSSLAAKNDLRFRGVSAGTSFFDESLSKQVNGYEPLKRSSIDRFSIIVMGGIAAEALEFNRADGGAGDEQSLIMFLSQINPRGGGALRFAGNSELIRNQARWGALQAVLLLKAYKPAYDALVDALERGGNLGDCIYSIEQACRIHNLKPMIHPQGYIVDRNSQVEGSPYAELEWVPYNEQKQQEQSSIIEAASNAKAIAAVAGKDIENNNSTSDSNSKAKEDSSSLSSEEFLQQYRKQMLQKLKQLDDENA